jgi:hypothetical protein
LGDLTICHEKQLNWSDPKSIRDTTRGGGT